MCVCVSSDEAGTDQLVKKEYVPVPIPVPVYVPVPMNLYAQTTPAPVTIPVPVSALASVDLFPLSTAPLLYLSPFPPILFCLFFWSLQSRIKK